MLDRSLTAAAFIGLVVTVENAVTALARWNTFSTVTPILSSSTIYVTTAFTGNSGTIDIVSTIVENYNV